MNLNEYKEAARRTWTASADPNADLAYLAMGLVGEAAEVSEQAKKVWRHGHPLLRHAFVDELSDVIWYWMLLVSELGLDGEEILEYNVAKLQRRYPEGFTPERSRRREDAYGL